MFPKIWDKLESKGPAPGYKPAVSKESFTFLIMFFLFFGLVGRQMGIVNMVNTMMNTAHLLLMDTVFYIMAIAVLAGAISGLFTEFGVVALINNILSPLMKPLYNLPGASVLGVLTTYLSDNPAILTLADDDGFRCFFKKYQLPALTNLGTSFGMGMIITAYMIGLKGPGGESFILNVKGDSMINAGIFDGDRVFVNSCNTARNGDMVVALIDDSATVKTFYRENGHIRLQPENDTMDPIIVNDCQILGKVFGVFRFYR